MKLFIRMVVKTSASNDVDVFPRVLAGRDE